MSAQHKHVQALADGQRGHFVSALASAWFKADVTNRARLEMAFPLLVAPVDSANEIHPTIAAALVPLIARMTNHG